MAKVFLTLDRLTVEQVNLIKGVGILLIVLHNFFHNLPPALGENEFNFNPQLLGNYIEYVSTAPGELFGALFSIWGHHGVELFILTSAYGVTIACRERPKPYLKFQLHNLSKLYISFVICVIAYVCLGLLKQQFVTEQVLYWDSLAWKLLLISNFIPGQGLMPVGPWWFVPFIFQFYLILPIILWLYKRYSGAVLLLISVAGYAFEVSYLQVLPQLNYSPFGHLPLFCLGIYLANAKKLSLSWWHVFASLAIFSFAQLNYYVWAIGDVAIAVLLLALTAKMLFERDASSFVVRGVHFFGGISLHLFLVNGFLRSPFKALAAQLDSWWGSIIAAFASLIFSVLFALCLRWVENRLRAYHSTLRQPSIKTVP